MTTNKRHGLELRGIKDQGGPFVVQMSCSECQQVLNETNPLTGPELWLKWMRTATTSPFNTGRCPNCHYSTFTDLNIHTDLDIIESHGCAKDCPWQGLMYGHSHGIDSRMLSYQMQADNDRLGPYAAFEMYIGLNPFMDCL